MKKLISTNKYVQIYKLFKYDVTKILLISVKKGCAFPNGSPKQLITKKVESKKYNYKIQTNTLKMVLQLYGKYLQISVNDC